MNVVLVSRHGGLMRYQATRLDDSTDYELLRKKWNIHVEYCPLLDDEGRASTLFVPEVHATRTVFPAVIESVATYSDWLVREEGGVRAYSDVDFRKEFFQV